MKERLVSKNIRKARSEKKMSLENLAELAGLTKGYLSKIENSDKAPPLSTLSKIARALNLDVEGLITPELYVPRNDQISIVRNSEGKKLQSGNLDGYHYEMLALQKSGRNMEPYLIRPAFDEKAIFTHEGEEFLYTLEGSHELIFGGEKYTLSQGDSAYFDSIVPHTGRSLGEKRAKVLAVSYSYKRIPNVETPEKLVRQNNKIWPGRHGR